MQENTLFLTNARQQKIYYYLWTPDNAPAERVLLLVHGYGEHAGRYRHVAEALTNAGYAVYGIDHRGHGKSEGERVYFQSFEEPVEDLRLLFNIVKKAHPTRPIYMLGHSMGSLIALLFAVRYQDDLAGLIISGSATNAEEGSTPLMVIVGSLLAKVVPTARLLAPVAPDALTRDEAMLKLHADDPLNDFGNMRLGMAKGMIDVGRALRKDVSALKLPILVIHGEDDKLTPISGAHAVYNGASSRDKTLKTYPLMRHEVLNEIEREQVIADVLAWLAAH